MTRAAKHSDTQGADLRAQAPLPVGALASPPIFVGGCPRSGTTLLRVILDSHAEIACGPELRVIPTLASLAATSRRVLGPDLAEHYDLSEAKLDAAFSRLMRSFLSPLQMKAGKPRIAEKTPANALHFAELARLFPQSPFIQIVRDGRDVVASLLTMDWKDAKSGERMPFTLDAGCAAEVWAAHVRSGRKARERAEYFEIGYEDLVTTPRSSLTPLFEFLGVPWSDAALHHHRNRSVSAGMNESSAAQVAGNVTAARVGRWKSDLTPEQKTAVKAAAGDLLIELGYVRDFNW
jgi:hypothetical protein